MQEPTNAVTQKTEESEPYIAVIAAIKAVKATPATSGKALSSASAWSIMFATLAYAKRNTREPGEGAIRNMVANVMERNPRSATATRSDVERSARALVTTTSTHEANELVMRFGLTATIVAMARVRQITVESGSTNFDKALASLESAFALLPSSTTGRSA